ncbi:MAG TPA: hypothetical protein VF574_05600 [Allosphingosinicella sp.]|jgi:hypothetical protein
MAVILVILAVAGGVVLAIVWQLSKNGTLLIRVGTLELRPSNSARFTTVTFNGAPHLIVIGYGPGSYSSRGVSQMTQTGSHCHVEVSQVLNNPGQASGNYVYAFPVSEPCKTVTFGKNRVAVAPADPTRSKE